MVSPQDFALNFSEANGKQLVVARIQHDGRNLQFLYARPKGCDTWFGFVGMGGSLGSASKPKNIPNNIRETADEAVFGAEYPIRTISGKKSLVGQIELFFGGVQHIYSFITHPNNFYVYRTNDSQPAGTLGSDDTYIEIVDEKQNQVTVQADSGSTAPPQYAIEEAVLFRYQTQYGSQNLPDVRIQ